MKSTKITQKDTTLQSKPRFGSLSDFLTNASQEEQNRLFTEAARQANEDQRAVMRTAGYTFEGDAK